MVVDNMRIRNVTSFHLIHNKSRLQEHYRQQTILSFSEKWLVRKEKEDGEVVFSQFSWALIKLESGLC